MHLVFFFLLLKLGVQGKNIAECELHLTCRTDLHAACYRFFFWSCMMQDWHLPCAFLLVSYVLCTLDTRGSSHLYASE